MRRGIRIFTPDKAPLRENVARSGHRPLAMEFASGFAARRARGVRVEIAADHSMLLTEFAFAELKSESDAQQLRLLFAMPEVLVRGRCQTWQRLRNVDVPRWQLHP